MMIIRTHKQQEVCLRSLGLVGGSEGCETFWAAIPTSRRHGVIHPVAKGETVIAIANDKSCCQEEREREREREREQLSRGMIIPVPKRLEKTER